MQARGTNSNQQISNNKIRYYNTTKSQKKVWRNNVEFIYATISSIL